MNGYFNNINRPEDFDRYYDDFLPASGPSWFHKIQSDFRPFKVFSWAIQNYDIFHHPFSGGFLGATPFWRLEAPMLHWAGCKVVVIPYGADAFLYSRLDDLSLRQGLLMSYPNLAREETRIGARVDYWNRHADAVVAGFMVHGMGRWDCIPVNPISIDTSFWVARDAYSSSDGQKTPVRVMHAPNHRGIKGTEFIIRAVEELQREGLKIEFRLIEGLQNDQVKKMLQSEVDILVDQIIIPGYGLNAIEGMACGVPVLANLDQEKYTRVFRRYSFLDECPILAANHETIKEDIRSLVVNPGLRETLGRAGRHYAEKYHSIEAAKYLFGAIYDKIWQGKDVDLIGLFHPLKSACGESIPKVQHPLANNRIPEGYSLQ